MDVCNSSDWTQVFLTQFVNTLGQLTALLVSGSVVVPVMTYYSKGFRSFVGKDD